MPIPTGTLSSHWSYSVTKIAIVSVGFYKMSRKLCSGQGTISRSDLCYQVSDQSSRLVWAWKAEWHPNAATVFFVYLTSHAISLCCQVFFSASILGASNSGSFAVYVLAVLFLLCAWLAIWAQRMWNTFELESIVSHSSRPRNLPVYFDAGVYGIDTVFEIAVYNN